MSLSISYESEDFPKSYSIGSGVLNTSWSEIIHAAITIGRPSMVEVFQHNIQSLYEALFRLSILRLALEEKSGNLFRTDAFRNLDPTEKGMISYFIGMTACKLFASKILETEWLLHLDVYRPLINPMIIGRSRPDLIGKDVSGRWHAFESKGRSGPPSSIDKAKAKNQANRLVAVGGTNCSLHIGSFAYFKSDKVNFYWRDPDPETEHGSIEVPEPESEWEHHYKNALALVSKTDDPLLAASRELADVTLEIHPKIFILIKKQKWQEAHLLARKMRNDLIKQGYYADGIKVEAGDSWSNRELIR